MIVEQIWTANAYRNFNYLIACAETGEALAIDPLDHAKCLGVAGSMIAQAVKVHDLIEADHRELVAENTHLRFELKERYGFPNIVGTRAGRCATSLSSA